jgi:hypothetical protein
MKLKGVMRSLTSSFHFKLQLGLLNRDVDKAEKEVTEALDASRDYNLGN